MLESKNWTIPRKQSCYALINIHIFEIVSFQNSIFLGGNKKKKKLKASFCNKIDLIEFYFSFFSFYFYPTFSTKTFQFTRFFLPCTLSIQKFFSILSISIAIKKKKRNKVYKTSLPRMINPLNPPDAISPNISPLRSINLQGKNISFGWIFRTKIKKKKKRKEGYFNARSTRELTRWKI